jgi:energy-coupling factor transport system permease protein
MTDIRFRLAVILLLSFLAFSSLPGAAAAAVWWLIFGAKQTLGKKPWKLLLGTVFFTAAVPSLVTALSGGGGAISYAVRMAVIVLLAFWFGSCRKPGEFLDLFVWAFGNRTGFDLGLAAELSIQALYGISDDFSRQKTALAIKGQALSVKTLPGLAAGLLFLSLSRAGNAGTVLARRGYTSGGTYIPAFSPAKTGCAGFCSALLLTAAVTLFTSFCL